MDREPSLPRRNSFANATEVVDKRRAHHEKRERYNAWILHRSRDGRTEAQQQIINDFYDGVKAFLTTLFTGIHGVASGTGVASEDNGIVGLLQSCLQFIPEVGSILQTATKTITDNQRKERMKRISILLGNFGQMDALGEDFAAQMTAYHQQELTQPSNEVSRVASVFAPLSQAIKKVTDFILGKKPLPHVGEHRELLELIVAQAMVGLVQASALLNGPEDLAEYLSSQQRYSSHQLLPLLFPWSEDEITRWQNSYHALRLSILSYEYKSKIDELAGHFGFRSGGGQYHYFLTKEDTRCFIFANEHQLSCTFRGTSTLGNVITDLDAIAIDYKDHQVHRGFYKALEPLWEQLQAIFAAHQRAYPQASLLFTGHSLGGALATLAGVLWLEQSPGAAARLQVITFGQPRVFKHPKVSTAFQGCFHRFVNKGDPVPLLPPEPVFGYQHLGRAYYFPEDNIAFSWTAKIDNPGKSVSQHSLLPYLSQLVLHAKNAQVQLVSDPDHIAFQHYADQETYQRAVYQRLDISDGVPPINLPQTTLILPRPPVHELPQLIRDLQAHIAGENSSAITQTAQQLLHFFKMVPIISFPYKRAGELEDILWSKEYPELPIKVQFAILTGYYQCLLQGLFTTGGRGYQPKVTNWEARLTGYKPLATGADVAALVFIHIKLICLLKLASSQHVNPNPYIVMGLATLQNLLVNHSQRRTETIESCNAQLDAAQLRDDFAQVLLFDVIAMHRELDLVLVTWVVEYIAHHAINPLSTIALGSALELLLRAVTHFDTTVRYELLISNGQHFGLHYWIEKKYVLSEPATQWIIEGMLQEGLQLATQVTNDPILKALVTNSKTEQALQTIIENSYLDANLRVSMLLRLYDLQRQEQVKNDQLASVLSYEQLVNLGTLAFEAKQYELAKGSYIKAYRYLKAQPGPFANYIADISNKIAAIITQQMYQLPDEQIWEKIQNALEILHYQPNHKVAIERLFTLGLGAGMKDIKERLGQIAKPIDEAGKATALKQGNVVITTTFNGIWVLSDKVLGQLFDGAHLRASNRQDGMQVGRHRVACVGAKGKSLHIKEDPGHVGLAFAAWALSEWIYFHTKVQTQLLVPVEPALIERTYLGELQRIVVQTSPTILGDSLRSVFNTANETVPAVLKRLNAAHYSALTCVSMLLDMEDARPANWIVEEPANTNNQARLVSIDNDHVWVKDEINAQNILVVKNIVYCLDNMGHAVDAGVREAILDRSFSHTNRMKAWLYNLQYYNDRIVQVFGAELLKTLHERNNEEEKVILEAYSHPENLGRLYFKWFLLRGSLEQNAVIDHWNLFEKVQPRLASRYKNAKGGHPKKRFENLTEGLFTPGGGTQTTNSQLTAMVLGSISQNYKDFAKARTTPESLLQLLGDLQSNAMLDFIERDVQYGNLSLFRDMPGAHTLQEVLLLRLSMPTFKEFVYTPMFHQRFLASLSNEITHLTFKENTLLTDDELWELITRMPKLMKITLEGCDKITGFTLPKEIKGFWLPDVKVPSVCWLIELCKRDVKTIKLARCENLSIKLLDLLRNYWQSHPKIEWDIQAPKKWGAISTLVDVAMAYPDKGLLIPSMKYLQLVDQKKSDAVRRLEIRCKSVSCLTAMPNGFLATGGTADNNSIIIWKIFIASHSRIHTLVGHSSEVLALTVLHDGLLVSGALDGTIKIWEVNERSFKLVHTLEGHTNGVVALTVLHDGLLASGALDGTIKIWEVNTLLAKLKYSTEGYPTNCIYTLTVLRDGRLVSGAKDGSIKIWKFEQSGKLVIEANLKKHHSKVTGLSVLQDGMLVSIDEKSTINMWNVNTYPAQHHISLQQSKVAFDSFTYLTVLHNGWVVVADGKFITLRGQNAQSFGVVASLSGHDSDVCALTVLHDGRLVSGSKNGTVIIWALRTYELDERLNNSSKTTRLKHNALELLRCNQLRIDQVPLLFNSEVVKNLTTLDVSNTYITDSLLKAILDCCKKLRAVQCNNCGWLTKAGIALITERQTQPRSTIERRIHFFNSQAAQATNSSATATTSTNTSDTRYFK